MPKDAENMSTAIKIDKIVLPNGDIVPLSKGTGVTKVQTIAGKGRDRRIDEVAFLISKFGGTENEWQKKKGICFIDIDDEQVQVEIHWYEEQTVGVVKVKIKPQRGGEWYV